MVFHGTQPDIYLPSNLCNFNYLKIEKLRSGGRGRRPHVPGRGGEGWQAAQGARAQSAGWGVGGPPLPRRGLSPGRLPLLPLLSLLLGLAGQWWGSAHGEGRGNPGATACAPSNAQATPRRRTVPGRPGPARTAPRASSPGAGTGFTAVHPQAQPHRGKATTHGHHASPPTRPSRCDPRFAEKRVLGTPLCAGSRTLCRSRCPSVSKP